MSIDGIFVDSILESMPLGCMIINAMGEVVLVNDALSELLGFTRQELTSDDWGERFFSRQDNHQFNQILVDVINQEPQHLQRETPYTLPGEVAPRRLSVTSSFLRSGGDVAGIVLLVEDVTERYARLEREAILYHDLAGMQQERSESLRRLALSVAHQVRNPAMTIGGFASLMLKGQLMPDQARQKLGIIREEAVKLERTVKAVASYASLPQMQRRSISVPELVRTVVEEAKCECCKVVREVECDTDCQVQHLMADPDQVRHALRAVFTNAFESAIEGKVRVEVEVSPGEEAVRIIIKDNGGGISKDDMPFIFDPFFTTKPASVGMGLCEARLILLEHHGSVHVESQPGQGATVTLLFPYSHDEPKAAPPAA